MLVAGCWMLDAGCWLLDAGCWLLDSQVAGCWKLPLQGFGSKYICDLVNLVISKQASMRSCSHETSNQQPRLTSNQQPASSIQHPAPSNQLFNVLLTKKPIMV